MSARGILASMSVEVSARTSRFGQAMKQGSTQLHNFQNSVNNVNSTLRAFGVGFGIYEVARGVQKTIGIMATFERTMSEVKAITGATKEQFEALEKDALKLGASTKYTSSQVGQLQIAFGRLGFSTREILAATGATLDLAAATGEDLAKSADVAGSTVRGFELNAKETQRVVDVMASSFNKTALSLDNFTESMKYVAPVGNAAGATVEEVTAMLGVLADAGIRGSMAGTSLRKIFTDMTKDGRPLQERLAELAKKGLTLQDSFDEVGRTAQTSLLILSKNTDKITGLTTAFEGASGEAAKMARIMQDNLTGDVTKLTSAFEGLILAVSNSEGFRNIVQNLTSVVNFLSGSKNLDEAFKNVAANIKAFNEVDPTVLKGLADVRKEMGKPIDLSNIEAVAEKYRLTDKQANILWQAVRKANEEMSFQEKVLGDFQKFSDDNAYKDLSKAVDGFKQKIYESIVAQQIERDKEPNFRQFHDDQISSYRRMIEVLNEYKASLDGVGAALDKVFNFPAFRRPAMATRPDGMPDSIYKGDPINMDPNSSLGIDPEEPLEGLVKEIEFNAELAASLENINNLRDQQIEKMMQTAAMAETMGMAIGDAFGQMIKGEQNFAQVLAKVTEQIINLYLQQSIAGIIKSAIEDPSVPFPFAKVAIAAAGIGAVKALFSGIGGSSSAGTGGGAMRGRLPSEMGVNVNGEIHGDTIRLVSRKNEKWKTRTG